MTRRTQQMGEFLREEVTDIIRTELDDPRLGFWTITHVDVSQEIRSARIFVSVLGTEQERKIQSGRTLLFRQSHRCPGNTQRMALIRQGHAPKKRLDLFRQMFRNKTSVSCRKLRPNGLKKLPYSLHHEMYSRLV